jgi:tetratricopeptide (TPR) repeat protein
MGCLKTSLVMSQISDNLIGIAHSKSGMSSNYGLQNKPDLALTLSEEALDAATENEDIMALQPAYTTRGVSFYYKGDLYEAEKNLLQGLAYYEKASIASWGAWAAGHLGWTYHDMRNYDKAKKHHQQCVSILEDTRYFPSWINCHKLGVKNNRILNGEHDIDIHKLDALIKAHEKNRLAVCESFGARCIGDIYLNIDDQHMAEAESWIKRCIDAESKHGMLWNLGKAHALYADWFKKKGDIQGAKEQLTKGIDYFRECGADGWVTITEEKLAGLM